MEETVLFNRGNAVASGYDYKQLYRMAQIMKEKEGTDKSLVLVKKMDDEEMAVFYYQEKKKETDNQENLTKYIVMDVLP